MKKPPPVEIKEDRPTKARRRARSVLGPVKPARVITPKVLKDSKYKKTQVEEESS